MRNNIKAGFIVLLSTQLVSAGSQQKEIKDLTPETGSIIVTDFMGREVTLKKDIQYVGSLFAVASHLVAMLGDADRIVTIPQGNVRDLLFCEMYPSIKQARVVKRGNSINIEEIAKNPRPEVCIVNPELALDEGQMALLEKLRTPVISIAYSNMKQQMEMVELMGRILGREEKAKAYIEYYQRVIEMVNTRTADIPAAERKSVYHAINELLRTDQDNTLSTDWIQHVGVKNVAIIEPGESHFTINKNYMALEELLEKNPDFILINGANVYDYIERNTQLHNLKAYRNGNIHLLPLGVTRWGHPYSIETPLALLWTAKTIYPEHFSDINIEKETKEFYRTFFEYELSEAQLKKILSGRGYKDIKGSGH